MGNPMTPRKTRKSEPKWLWWLALLILAAGGATIYMLSKQEITSNLQSQINLTAAITIVAAGICIICVTANWWMRH